MKLHFISRCFKRHLPAVFGTEVPSIMPFNCYVQLLSFVFRCLLSSAR